ncbi:mannose-1-phosphate guanylyltransferase [filamentous cyanobacterium LEGE 11480]|uniref:Mannose-1-phosphate guanylyltransferase n=1 Tax=Romeriopsis navalis LEGE 11480 TaxID=2777977 RepID=A0A928Z4Y8_9CYAN|nr:mannose-1-phosphate guanylyltransferase [Romeriopsis navalis]MBE9030903.1 mannose-1-phosphate guanylyltransferase [Romeriopsis navalis LEGE 11480]
MSQSTTPTLIPVILAGGKGERFWPLSRRSRPKQFLCLDGGDRSLLQATADRLLATSSGWENLWVVTAAHLESGMQAQLPELPDANLLVEPEGRDTAPALAWSTLEVAKRYGEDAVLGFFPADHWIADLDIFQATLAAAAEMAVKDDVIVTLGIAPAYASTGYGYIEQGDALGEYGEGYPAYKVSRFTEKPDRQTAEEFIQSGRFSWNGGMFVFKASTVLQELEKHAPEILNPLKEKGIAAYGEVPKNSIDYALMEKTTKATVMPVKFGWDDLGDWGAIDRLRKSDAPNVELAQHVGLDTAGSLLYSTSDDDLIVTIGMEDTVIVRDGNVTLVVKKDRTQDIKQVLKTLREMPAHQDLL